MDTQTGEENDPNGEYLFGKLYAILDSLGFVILQEVHWYQYTFSSLGIVSWLF